MTAMTTMATPERSPQLDPLAAAAALGIISPRWEHDVPFLILNRSVDDRRAGARPFRFESAIDGGRQRVAFTLRAPGIGLVDELHGRIRVPDRGGEMSRVVVAGASGFMGRALVEALRADGEVVATIGRGPEADAGWGDADAILAVVDGASVVVNLAGRSVNCRYTAANRAEILSSRIDTTRAIGIAIGASTAPPPLWLNSSTATIYRHAEDRPQSEADGELGTGFSVGIATAWEAEFFAPALPSTRRVALRTAIVLGDGGVLTPLARLSRLGLGGAHVDGPWFPSRRRAAAGTEHRWCARRGTQRFSWIHLDDVIEIIRFIRAHPELEPALRSILTDGDAHGPSKEGAVPARHALVWSVAIATPFRMPAVHPELRLTHHARSGPTSSLSEYPLHDHHHDRLGTQADRHQRHRLC
jgi:hypothetical protein